MEERVLFLVSKFQSGQLAPDEKAELLDLINDYPLVVSDEITKMLAAHSASNDSIKHETIDRQKWNTIIEKILSIDKPVLIKKKTYHTYFKWAVAAIALLALAITLHLYNGASKTHNYVADIPPGGNKAILTLANGKKISLSDAANGDLVKEAGMSISKTADGQLVYNIEGATAVGDDEFNTISTPNGGEWQIRLPDGSVVWLNAASSLSYPLNIGSTIIRKVKLKGEAYFEVAKQAVHPFIVETEKQKLEVLGTHFNVNSYANENIVRTTLLEGSVRIAKLESLSAYEILKPGQQSVLSTNGIQINNVDTDESIAWKNGYFMFNNERQESIMRKIARWYNVNVEYADQRAKDVVYYGTVSRFDKISQVLRKFEQTGEVRFEINGNKLTVYKE